MLYKPMGRNEYVVEHRVNFSVFPTDTTLPKAIVPKYFESLHEVNM